MNQVLQSKIDELEKANKYECWYLVKQPTAFDNLCYLVSFLLDYKDELMESKSLRLNLFPDIKKHIPDNTDLSLWKVKDMQWIKDCPVPADEEFKRVAELWEVE